MLPLLLLLPLISAHPLDSCPGYRATNVQTTDFGLTANLTLAGEPCNVYGQDLQHLLLQVTYETDHRLHVKIQDVHNQVYQVPPSVFPRPANPPTSSADTSALLFTYTASPFSFAVVRRSTADILFDTSPAPLVFQSQYLRLRTALPPDPNLYGLGEHADSFRLNASGRYIRTLWNRDSYAVPRGTNLYGSHPVYLEQRSDAAHAVFLLNSNGMDVVLDRDPAADGTQYLEYNTLGGVMDLYFFAGPDPQAVARQYAAVAGTPAMPPYWSLGFHNCRWGYRDAFELAEVVRNYSAAAIPLETLWTDIDYMDRRRVFSLDPRRFPRRQMRALVDHLHANNQRYVVMVDPAVAYADYPPLRRGIDRGAFLRDPRTGADWRGVVWPGLAAFPDWFAEGTEEYWVDEFRRFFSRDDGLDIDGLWIDMNEPSVFDCGFLCNDPVRGARGFPPPAPPVRAPPREIPGWPCVFQPQGCDNHTDPDTATESTLTDNPSSSDPIFSPPTPNPSTLDATAAAAAVPGTQKGLPGRDLLFPRYAIHNKAAYVDAWNADRGGLSNRTVNTDVIHRNGYAVYDTHNLYGAQMSTASHAAMLARRPGLRPFIITRSTFAGAGRRVGHWLGDNLSTWDHYRASIRGMLAFTAVYQFGMIGADVCGFSDAQGPATPELCARWAALGAFYPFFRNHNTQGAAPHEFYRWDSVARAAREAIHTRYRLLDYLYTAMRRASADGTPAVAPVFYHYPQDPAAWPLELQFFFGPALMVCPVTEEGATSVDVYLPDDAYYDWYTYEPVYGRGRTHTFTDVDVGSIPLLVRAGYIVPMRNQSASTTTELREHGFELLIPVDYDRHATGELYLDDGVSIEQKPSTVTHITFTYNRGVLTVNGTFAGNLIPCITKIVILGEQIVNDTIASRKRANKEEKLSRSVQVNISLNEASKITI